MPEVAPQNITIRQSTNSSVLVTWQPLPDDPELWNTENKIVRKYKLSYYEYTVEGSSEINVDVGSSWYEIKSLEAGRGYKVAISAANDLGAGVKSDYYCIRLSETGTKYDFLCSISALYPKGLKASFEMPVPKHEYHLQ